MIRKSPVIGYCLRITLDLNCFCAHIFHIIYYYYIILYYIIYISNSAQVPITGWIQKQRGKPLRFHDKCLGFFYVHYTTHGTYSFTSHLKDKAIMVKCLAQGHKRRDRLFLCEYRHVAFNCACLFWVYCNSCVYNSVCLFLYHFFNFFFVSAHFVKWNSSNNLQVNLMVCRTSLLLVWVYFIIVKCICQHIPLTLTP